MMRFITDLNTALNNFVWGVPLMIAITVVGILLSAGTGFVQFRKFGYAMKTIFGRMFEKKKDDGSLTPFQAVCTALAATVGTGNIAGVAGAIAIGGPGAVFWMWMSALLGMCTKFAEVTLAVHYRQKNERGELVGGPMYFIKNGLGKNWYWLAYLYAAFGSLCVFGIGNTTQANTIRTAIVSFLDEFSLITEAQHTAAAWVIGIVMSALVALVMLGGIKRLGSVTEKLVPFMAIFYVVLGLGVVIVNIGSLPSVFAAIIGGAFSPQAFTGGIVGSMMLSMKKGVARGIFSNEAGMGTGSIAHACADTDEPVRQGMYGIFEVFADTLVICTLTALVILCSGVAIPYGEEAGAALTISAFTATYGSWVSAFTAIALCCFAFSTIIGWSLYGQRCLEFLFNTDKVIKPFLIIYSLIVIVGATADLGIIWSLSDTFNGLMMIPNLTALILLSPVVFKLTKKYFSEN